MKSEYFSPSQSRGARGLLDWTQRKLASRAGVELLALERYESGKAALSSRALARITDTFSHAGILATASKQAGEGVRWRRAARYGSPGRQWFSRWPLYPDER
jgi:transcriptional regulator with XRE-family HTH domain